MQDLSFLHPTSAHSRPFSLLHPTYSYKTFLSFIPLQLIQDLCLLHPSSAHPRPLSFIPLLLTQNLNLFHPTSAHPRPISLSSHFCSPKTYLSFIPLLLIQDLTQDLSLFHPTSTHTRPYSLSSHFSRFKTSLSPSSHFCSSKTSPSLIPLLVEGCWSGVIRKESWDNLMVPRRSRVQREDL
jgi:hypothetical protein